MTDVSTTCAEAIFRVESSESSHLTLKMASAQVVETSVINNSPSQDSYMQCVSGSRSIHLHPV